jgi:hypothetical protein
MIPDCMKKKHLLLLGLITLVLTSGFFIIKPLVIAQIAGQTLEVSPPSQEVNIDPGQTITVKAKIRNRSNTALPVDVRIEDFLAKGEEGQVELSADSPYSVMSWAKVSPKTFTLPAGEEQEVTATITAPDSAAGGRFGSFVFSVKPEPVQGAAASVAQEVASLFLVKVSGSIDEKLAIRGISSPSFSEFGPVPFDINFTNSGNVHVKAYGLVNVTDMFGNKVADIVVPATNVFPGADRAVKAKLNNQFLFGQYTATALMYYGSANDSLQATTTFIVFPVRIVAIVLGILFILFLMRKRLKKSLKALFK